MGTRLRFAFKPDSLNLSQDSPAKSTASDSDFGVSPIALILSTRELDLIQIHFCLLDLIELDH